MGMEPEVHKAPHIVYRVPCIMNILGFSHDWSVKMKLGDGHVDSRVALATICDYMKKVGK